MESQNSSIAKYEQFMLEVERTHNVAECQQWMSDNWALGIYSSVIYVLAIYGGRLYMKNRPRLDLQYPLVIWNLILTVFSIIGTIRVFPAFTNDMFNHGYHYVLCEGDCNYSKPGSYWGYLFAWSKIIELGDTLFIVLRKRDLIFLHYYHHVTVLLYCWHFYPQRLATNRIFATMNFFVHSLLYLYYLLKALKIRVPKYVNITITSLQIMQMVIGLGVNIYSAKMLSSGVHCAATKLSIQCALAMYFSYFVLFSKFFYDVYIRRKESKKANGSVNGSNHIGNGVAKRNGKVEENGVVKNNNNELERASAENVLRKRVYSR